MSDIPYNIVTKRVGIPDYKLCNGKSTQVNNVVAINEIFSEKCKRAGRWRYLSLTPLQYQILLDIKQNVNNNATGNILTLNNLKHAKKIWILD